MKKLTDKKVIEILAHMVTGKTTAQIQREAKVTRQQVAAVKAHVSMGTYTNPKWTLEKIIDEAKNFKGI